MLRSKAGAHTSNDSQRSERPYGSQRGGRESGNVSNRRSEIKKSSATLVSMTSGGDERHARVASVIGLQGLNHDYQKTSDDPLVKSFKARKNPHNRKTPERDFDSQAGFPLHRYFAEGSTIEQRNQNGIAVAYQDAQLLADQPYRSLEELGSLQQLNVEPPMSQMDVTFSGREEERHSSRLKIPQDNMKTRQEDGEDPTEKYLKLPGLANHAQSVQAIPKLRLSQGRPRQLDWLVLDPHENMNALTICSWNQVEDIKILVKLKLAERRLRLDLGMIRDLENFVALKRKHEIYRRTLQRRKASNSPHHQTVHVD